jgi:NitT/TauT family transport system ATP-binding protein
MSNMSNLELKTNNMGPGNSGANEQQAVVLQNCSFHFDGLKVVENVSIDIKQGEFFSILGPSGCGKSTLLRLMLNLLEPDQNGSVQLGDPTFKMGMVFQKSVLMPWLTAIQNVELPLMIGPDKINNKNERKEKAQKVLDLVGLQEFANHYPQQLSGGMQQRVAIARALVADSNILLMDEPFGALDELTREILNLELLKLWENPNTGLKTIIMVTHSIQEAVFLSDRVAIMSARPTQVQQIVDIPLPRPRRIEMQEEAGFYETVQEIRGMVKQR